jgi:hypothetical protein
MHHANHPVQHAQQRDQQQASTNKMAQSLAIMESHSKDLSASDQQGSISSH